MEEPVFSAFHVHFETGCTFYAEPGPEARGRRVVTRGDYVDILRGKLIDPGETDEEDVIAATLQGFLVQLSAMRNARVSVFEEMDAEDGLLLDACEELFDLDEEEVRERVLDAAGFHDAPASLLVVDCIEVAEPYRGHGLGAAFVKRALESFGGQGVLVVLFPRGGEETDPPRPRPERQRAERRMAAYWLRHGFRALPGTRWLAYATHEIEPGAEVEQEEEAP